MLDGAKCFRQRRVWCTKREPLQVNQVIGSQCLRTLNRARQMLVSIEVAGHIRYEVDPPRRHSSPFSNGDGGVVVDLPQIDGNRVAREQMEHLRYLRKERVHVSRRRRLDVFAAEETIDSVLERAEVFLLEPPIANPSSLGFEPIARNSWALIRHHFSPVPRRPTLGPFAVKKAAPSKWRAEGDEL